MKVDAHLWQFGVDYPGAEGDDSKLPLRSMNVKVWDGISWMSNFDSHPAAVSGPVSIAKLVKTYQAQGMELLLWCNPNGTNVSRMLALSKACVDVPGVKGLIFDVEPFQGFCASNCTFLATTLMKQLRASRPNKWLGVTYDPRPQHWGPSGITEWLKYANGASPMMYWESFKDNVQPWPDPAASVRQAHSDLRTKLAPGRAIEYFPIMQGNTSGAKMTAGINAAKGVGSIRVSLWRRGIVPLATWQDIAAIAEPAPPKPEPVPPPPDCSELERKVAELNHQVDVLRADLIACSGKLTDCDTELSTCKSDLIDARLALRDAEITLATAKKAWADLGRALS